MQKDFAKWHSRKTWLNNEKPRVFFNKRDVWWCSLGSNVGFEQDGKGAQYSRPVLVFKKFNNEVFWAVPFTTKNKSGKYYSPATIPGLGQQTVVLSQLRLVDSKRLLRKMGTINETDYVKIQKAIITLCEL